MRFTALHRATGSAPGPLTDAILDAAVEMEAVETDDLDWKSELPPAKSLPHSDFPKDVAAMANSGGGVIVYGVQESEKAATGRVDVGMLSERHESSLRSAAVTAITPPVFGLEIHRLGADDRRAVVVEVPASVDGPHLIYKNDYFAAPVRNNADTVWMKERQVEQMYRARFDERRVAREALDSLYTETAAGRDTVQRAWLVAVARPSVARPRERRTRDEARAVISEAAGLALVYAAQSTLHPFDNVERLNPRPGLRRWVCVNTATSEGSRWKESWISLHHDGSVTVAAAVGAQRSGQDSFFEGGQVAGVVIECAVADLMALVRTSADGTGRDEYDIRVGIEWTGDGPLTIWAKDTMGFPYDGSSIPLARFTPVETTVDAALPKLDFYQEVHDLAQDCINQGGLSNVLLIQPPQPEDQ